MSESKFESAVFAARVHVKSGTFLSDQAVRDVCEEFLRLVAEQFEVGGIPRGPTLNEALKSNP